MSCFRPINKVVKVDNPERNINVNVFNMTATIEATAKGKLDPREQELVDEFTRILRKHRDQDSTTLARLVTHAFSLATDPKKVRQDKLALAMARGLEARLRLKEAEGGSLSSEEVARLLKISKTAVLKRLEAGRLLAWREERLQAARFPRWQFDEGGHVLPGLEEILAILNSDERLDAWGKILFFLQTRSALDDKRPLDLLRDGQTQDVSLAAQAYVE